MNTVLKSLILMLFIALTTTTISIAEKKKSAKKIEANKSCPICGMYPVKYEKFQCQIIFTDNSYEAFDSPLGLLIYVLFKEEYDEDERTIESIFFKDFIKNIWISAENTRFIVGSRVMGPMGTDFLPIKNENAATQLLKHENGAEIIHFSKINPAYLKKSLKNRWVHNLAEIILSEK